MEYSTPIKRHYTVGEQKERLPLYLQEFYQTRQLDRIKIDETEIQGYFEYSFITEKSYVTSPERSADGTIDNLNSYSTFFTPRLVIKYNYMHISDYRKLMILLNSKNEFVVECYDIVLDKRVRHKMYVATPEMPTIHQRYMEVLGIRNYTIELIGTNVGFDTVEVRYYDINGILIPEATQSVDKGTEAIINYNYIAPTGHRFDGQWTDSAGVVRNNGEAILIQNDLDLYAKTTLDGQYTLSFAYGNGNVLYSQSLGAVNNITITNGSTIDNAIAIANITLDTSKKFTFPSNGTGGLSVKYDEDKYTVPYDFKGWYWTPEANDSTRVYGSTKYNYAINRTIYQIYEPKKYSVTYVTNADNIAIDTEQFAYNSKVILPALRMIGFTFLGWYLDSKFDKVFSGIMPPKDITLYAKWVKNE